MAKTVVFTFGRMNPPTIGHEKLANKVKAVAKKYGGEPRIYMSHSQDAKSNPLDYNLKTKVAQQAFGIVKKSKAKQIIQISKELEKWCTSKKITFYCAKTEKHHVSTEEKARQWRYRNLIDLAQKISKNNHSFRRNNSI